ncbi:MAG: SDR family oxidoreductase [Parabacteroides sp.]|nr:SDR family oxidoreductase [Parabacteroides sp.]
MADNYLEKKYEAYQARKRSGVSPGAKKGVMQKTRRVFITGGAKGIGRAIVKAFRSAGHRVAFCDIDEIAGKETAFRTGTDFFHVDVSNKEALECCMEQLFATWGDIDIIINNVGISEFSPITETEVEVFDHILAVNLRPVFITARQLACHRREQESVNQFGRIINICSIRYLMSEPGSEGYAASKGGIYSLTHALSLSLAPWHITVNALSPGWIQNEDYDTLRTEDHAQHPSGRVGKPEDIARMCLFLCHEENDFINGENITIDGGMTKKMIYIE